MNPENTPPAVSSDNTRTIARNSFWYGVEMFVSLGLTFCTSVAILRVMGPTKISHFTYMVWLTNITIALGSVGIPVTTRKFMAEYLNRGEAGVARSIYLTTLQIQMTISVALISLSLLGVIFFEKPGRIAVSVVLVAAMAPRFIASIPSQANNAGEVMRRNTGPSLIGGLLSTVLTIVTLIAGWGLMGLAAAMLIGSTLECGLKIVSVEKWLAGTPRQPLASDLKKRMLGYSGQGLALMLLNIVVWDRSDLLILGWMNNDPNQITFFSVAFNLAERVLMIPSSFLGGLGVTMMAQFGRGRERLKEMTVDGARYGLLLSLPLLVGMACLSAPIVLVLYHRADLHPLIYTLAIVALMALPKSLVSSPTVYLQTTERQRFLIWCGCVCGAVDIGLDFLLTGRYGANGAAIANGTAQTLAAAAIWIYIWKADKLNLKIGAYLRVVVAGAIMAAGVLTFLRGLPASVFAHSAQGYAAMLAAVVLGAALWMIAIRITRALKAEDVGRFQSLSSRLPGALGQRWTGLIRWLAPMGAAV